MSNRTTTARRVPRPLRVTALTVVAAAMGLAATALTSAPALADTVTSPTGMVTLSGPSNAVTGVASTYTMTVTNTTARAFDGPLGVVASGSVPAGLTIARIAGCANVGGNHSTSFLCTMPNLPAGGSESATFTIAASAPGSYQLTFGASASQSDPGTGGNQTFGDSAALDVTAQPGATDIQVTGSSNNGSPQVNGTFNYTFQVKDNGPLAAAGVTFDNQLPSGITVVGTGTDNGSCVADPATNSVHCDIGSLAVGAQSDITITATPGATGVLVDSASIAMSGADTRPANNSVSVTVQPR